MERKKGYEADGITVYFEARRCIHAQRCVHDLPAVFDIERRPWIDPSASSADLLADVIHRCPSGALTYERTDGGPPEPIQEKPSITLAPNGPLFVRGRLEIKAPDGTTVSDEPRVALCRCGASKNKPFCDNSHRAIGFSTEE